MSASPPRRPHDAIVAWVAAGAIAITGYVLVVAPSQRRLRDIEFRAYDLYERANRNERAYAERRSLMLAHERVRRDLDRLAGNARPGRAMLATLELLSREAGAHHATVTSLAPADPDANAAGATRLTIELRGRYRDLLALCADVTQRDVLLEIEDADIVASSAPNAPAGEVDATLHGVVYRNIAAIMTEKIRNAP